MTNFELGVRTFEIELLRPAAAFPSSNSTEAFMY